MRHGNNRHKSNYKNYNNRNCVGFVKTKKVKQRAVNWYWVVLLCCVSCFFSRSLFSFLFYIIFLPLWEEEKSAQHRRCLFAIEVSLLNNKWSCARSSFFFSNCCRCRRRRRRQLFALSCCAYGPLYSSFSFFFSLAYNKFYC